MKPRPFNYPDLTLLRKQHTPVQFLYFHLIKMVQPLLRRKSFCHCGVDLYGYKRVMPSSITYIIKKKWLYYIILLVWLLLRQSSFGHGLVILKQNAQGGGCKHNNSVHWDRSVQCQIQWHPTLAMLCLLTYFCMIKILRFSVIQSKVFGFLYLSETEQKHTIRGNGVKITRILSKKKKYLLMM